MKPYQIVFIAAALGGLISCSSGPVVQGETAQFPAQNLKWWVSGRVVPDTKPDSIHIHFEGVPQFTQRLSESFQAAGYRVVSDAKAAQQDLWIQGIFESHGDTETRLVLDDVDWRTPRDANRERAIAKDAAVTGALSSAAVDANLMGQWWGVGTIANAVLHSTGLATRFNNFVLGTGRSYRRGWSDQTLKLIVQDRHDARQRVIIVAGLSSRAMWPDQLLEQALRELLRQYQVVQIPAPSASFDDLTALEDAMASTEVE